MTDVDATRDTTPSYTGDLTPLNELLGGRYVIRRELGRGGMATVYLAHDAKHERDVALKVLRAELGAAVGAERFLSEIKLTASLQHPNILPLFDSGSAGGLLYYVMPYVRGETLRAKLERERTLEVDEAIAIARGIARALDHAHAQGVIHRDVKPENVLLSDGVPMVADFGIARALSAAGGTRVTQTGVSLGTPAYMSPEQAMGDEDIDRRADVYSLGCVLYEMLTGHAPYGGATAAAVIAQHLTAPVPSVRSVRTTVPPLADAAIGRALAKERERRFASAGELTAALLVAPPVEPMPDYSQVTEPITRNTAPLAGRHREYAELVAKLDALGEGRGGIVLVGGEPGVGKTKLTEALLLEARRRGFVCSVGHCYEMDGAPPYLPFIEQWEYVIRTVPPGRFRAALGSGAAEFARVMPRLRQIYLDIPEPADLPPDQQRHFLFAQFREYFERATRNVPIVVLMDDLHWADESTLLLLEYLAPHVAQLRLLVLGTYRDVELDVGRPFAKTLERLARQRLADRIALRRMPASDVATLLAQLGAPDPPAALVQAIFSETEGNPFFVEEVFRHLRDEGRLLDGNGRWLLDLKIESLEVPEGVRLVIGRRLERVSEACRNVLTAAAVIGARFELAVLEAVAEVSADAMLDALEEAERAGLVIARQVRRDMQYTFAHELIRQTLVAALSLPRRLRRHLRTAEAMERVYTGREAQHASEIAYHFFQSGSASDEEKTTRYLLLAGQQAVAAGAFDEALAQVERAFSVMEAPDARRRADLLAVRGSALRGLGRWRDATAAYLEAFDRYEAAGAREPLLPMTCMLAEMLYYSADHARTASVVKRALDATSDAPSADRARLLALGASALGMSGDYAAGMSMMDDALRMSDAIKDPVTRAYVLCEQGGLLQNYGHIARAVPGLIEARGAFQRAGMRWGALWAGARLAHAYRFTDQIGRIADMIDELLREATAVGHVGAILTLRTAEVIAQWHVAPHVKAAAEAAALARREFGELTDWRELATLYEAWGGFERDDGGAFALGVQAAERYHFEPWEGMFWAVAFCALAYTDRARAVELLESRPEQFPTPGQPTFIGIWNGIGWLLLGLLRLGDRARAASLYPACLEMLEMGYVSDAWTSVEELAAITAAAGGRWDVAERHFERASRQAVELPHVAIQPDVRYWHAWMLLDRRAEGDVARARALLAEAIPLYESMGRTRGARECRELLGRADG